MRKLKFRAWAEPLKEMDYSPLNSMSFDGKQIFYGNGEITGFFDSIMQFTGLKDKNGKEIYEGDIVRYRKIIYTDCSRTDIEEIEEPIIGEFYYAEGLYLGIRSLEGIGNVFWPGTMKPEDFEVIGNIHENPELLGEGK